MYICIRYINKHVNCSQPDPGGYDEVHNGDHESLTETGGCSCSTLLLRVRLLDQSGQSVSAAHLGAGWGSSIS